MLVYLLEEEIPGEASLLYGVFSSVDKAKQHLAEKMPQYDGSWVPLEEFGEQMVVEAGHQFNVTQWEVDSPWE